MFPFKPGDKVRIVYPERSTWTDTVQNVLRGRIKTNTIYTIGDRGNNVSFEYPGSVYIILPDEDNFHYGLSYHCLVKASKLPNWL